MYQDEKANLEKENFALMEKVEQLARASRSVGALTQQDSVSIVQLKLFSFIKNFKGCIVRRVGSVAWVDHWQIAVNIKNI
uniref:Uncharacterized protein n=1 Tax=Meloidogyne javanica TaxID=6303 RepID=A0A915ML91_MELJA